MPYRRYSRANPRRYITHARLVIAGHPEGPAVLCLALLAVTWAVVGAGVVTGTSGDSPALVHTLIPGWLRVALWWAPALMALYTLATGRHTTATVTALTIAPAVRVASYLWAWLMYLIPGAPDGLSTGWYAATFHGVMIGLVVLAAMLTRPAAHDGANT